MTELIVFLSVWAIVLVLWFLSNWGVFPRFKDSNTQRRYDLGITIVFFIVMAISIVWDGIMTWERHQQEAEVRDQEWQKIRKEMDEIRNKHKAKQ